MAAISGIGVSEALTQAFSAAVDAGNVRFIKVAIQNESLVPVTVVDAAGSLENDLARLPDYLEDQTACYVLVRLDGPLSEWLAVSYVPDDARVREKMLYASTRNTLTRSLGSTLFTDTLFATSKSDVTPEAYAAHKRHQNAPKPLSAREQEMADIKAAEREGTVYEGSRARQNHLGTNEVGYQWSSEAENAVKELGKSEGSHIVVLQIDVSTETLVLNNASASDAESIGSIIPNSQPSFTLFAWANSYSETGREIVFIYSCPTSSPIKHRMVYSSGALSIYRAVKALIGDASNVSLSPKKIETSDPKELSEDYLRQELGFSDRTGNSTNNNSSTEGISKPSFARPKAPGRRR